MVCGVKCPPETESIREAATTIRRRRRRGKKVCELKGGQPQCTALLHNLIHISKLVLIIINKINPAGKS